MGALEAGKKKTNKQQQQKNNQTNKTGKE